MLSSMKYVKTNTIKYYMYDKPQHQLETKSLGDSPNHIWFQVSAFIEDFLRIGQQLHKFTHN